MNLKSVQCAAVSVAALSIIGVAKGSVVLDAEYAVRWDPAVSQINTAESVVELFVPGRAADNKDEYAITYLGVKQPTDLPEGMTLIVRERKKKNKIESTVKYRSRIDFQEIREKLAHRFSAGVEDVERKYEVDVSFVDEQKEIKAYSLSYVSDMTYALMPAYADAQRSAEKKMQRLTIKNFKSADGVARKLKIEYWDLGGDGKKLLEVSMPGMDDEQSRSFFKSEVLAPLLAKGVQPIERSKSELGATE